MPRPILAAGLMSVWNTADERLPSQIIGEILAAFLMKPVRQTMGLQRVEALEVEQRVDETRGRGIAVVDRHQVGAEGIAEIGVVAQRLVIGLPDQITRQRRMVETPGDAVNHRIFQPLVMQHG